MKMMKKAGFTLVELIVVITILAILGTIAFISLQGNTQDAKNSTVVSELRTIITAIESTTLKGGATFPEIHDTTSTGNYVEGTAFWGVTLTGGTNYNAGTINFNALKQSADSFTDPEGRDYIYAYATNGSEAYYQIAGEITEASGNRKQYIQGLYLTGTWSDVTGLISLANPWNGQTSTGGIINTEISTGTGSLY